MYSGGSGTIGDPYIIATPQDLYDIRSNLSAYFKLKTNIDLDGTSYDPWTPIGSFSTPFTGNLNGNGKVIKSMTIGEIGDRTGLFSVIENASIYKLGIINSTINPSSADNFHGMISGVCSGACDIYECYATGDITPGTGYLCSTVGGLFGRLDSSNSSSFCKVENCWTNVAIERGTQTSIGGICGIANRYSVISKCYAVGNVSGINGVGGIVGNFGDSTVENSASLMDELIRLDETLTEFYRIGIGSTYFLNNYANSAMALPRTAVSDANGQDGLDKTLTQLKTKSTYEIGLGWDFEDIWYMSSDFPKLRAFIGEASGLFFGTNF